MNKVELIGNLTKDVELTTTPSGNYVTRFTIAVQRRFTNENGEREADFINCVAWRNQAENLHKYCHKGDKVAVVGRIETGSYETENGEKRYTTDVVAEEIEFVSTKKAETNETELRPATKEEDDGLPF